MIDNSLKSDIKRSSKISGLNDHLYFIFLKELSLCQKSNILITKFLQPNVSQTLDISNCEFRQKV